MQPFNPKHQNGIALLIFVVMLMGVGGFALVGYSQGILKQVEVKKFKHNTRVLKEAKQAMLQFVYNYPVLSTPSIGPGRLPNADTDNDGIPDGGSTFGRLPWAQAGLNLYDIRDANGERLWYAISSSFRPQAAIVNSDTSGNLTLRDQQGNVIYDGSNPGGLDQYGIAAVIIAPGAVTARNGVAQDRSVANGDDPFDTTADTDPGIITAANYLDRLVGTEDNATRTLDSPTDGFILGPVDILSTDAVNDQFIVITAAEVITMAEKATLQAYRDAINDYLSNTNVYPWLDNYSTTDLTVFDADINTIKGRVPSRFGDYFAANTPVTAPIISDLRLSFEVAGGVALNFQIPASVAPDIFFDTTGDLSTSFASGFNFTRYYWDGHATTPDVNSPQDGIWELCVGTAGTGAGGTGFPEDDCNRKTDGNYKIPTDSEPDESDVWLEVIRLSVTFDSLGSSPFRFPFSDLQPFTVSPPNPSYTAATGGEQAYIRAEYNNDSGYLAVNYDYDADFQEDFDVQSSGGLDKLFVGLIYYPELPGWALTNDWHSSIQMAVAQDYQPGGGGDCTVLGCLVVNNLAGIANNKVSLLAIAGEHDDGIDDGAANFEDDLHALFEPENDTSNITYDKRAGNDKILVLQEQ